MGSRIICIALLLGACAMNCYAESGSSFNDPMRPVRYQQPAAKVIQPQAVQVDTSDWHLSAVLHSASRTVAVVNDTVMAVGDKFKGYRLVTILADRVVLVKNQKKVVLRREGTGIKKISVTEGNNK